MRLFLLPPSFKGQASIELPGKDFNYLIRVLRLKEGQKIMGRDREGALWDLELVKVQKTSCTISCAKADRAEARTDSLPEQRPLKPIVLYQCLPKGRKLDDIIRKAAEAGVRDIVLVKSRNCVSDIAGKEHSRLGRYDAIVAEAIQQSGSAVPTKVSGVLELKDIPKDLSHRADGRKALGLVLHQSRLHDGQDDLYGCIKGFQGETSNGEASDMGASDAGVTAIVVGPEGGLEEYECNGLLSEGFKAVQLKTNILRCETASIYAIGAVQTILESCCR